MNDRISVARERETWELLPAVGVGPLRFEMSAAEVSGALRVPEPRERVGGPYSQENFAGGVRVFYDPETGGLACVALDAVLGPQVFLAGVPLAGGDPGRGQEFLLEYAGEHGHWILFTPDGSLALTDVGVLLRDQKVGGVRLTRPVFVKEEWFESQYYRDHLPLEHVTD
ncbi:hypothetical protein ACGFZP_22080 [Kitasatospora sp. NPDC048239]|uniref:hypothetical protein n=1 Tax=Kitasatospora sp. NPDC048239 TaxID=3364046 RepID=UPI003715F8A2